MLRWAAQRRVPRQGPQWAAQRRVPRQGPQWAAQQPVPRRELQWAAQRQVLQQIPQRTLHREWALQAAEALKNIRTADRRESRDQKGQTTGRSCLQYPEKTVQDTPSEVRLAQIRISHCTDGQDGSRCIRAAGSMEHLPEAEPRKSPHYWIRLAAPEQKEQCLLHQSSS